MKKILVTAGPIPAKVDSVKILTNKFRGGLALATAKRLSDDFEVEIIKWAGTPYLYNGYLTFPTGFFDGMSITNVDDILSYRDAVLATDADAYVLAAAVANLMPTNPWEGKFPSHNYHVGEKFNIEFTIAPRIIDMVKERYPRKTLIGYKLFDGAEKELIVAGTHTLRRAKANVVFCNHPCTAKLEKIAVMPDGAQIRMSFDDHINFIKRVVNLEWYRTFTCSEGVNPSILQEAKALKEVLDKVAFTDGFGTFAIRDESGFFTTTRGKRNSGLCRVFSVGHDTQTICATAKATMNAPTLARMFAKHPDARYILHAHKQIEGADTFDYAFPGTTEEDKIPALQLFNIKHHGYYVAMNSRNDLYAWLSAHHSQH